MSTVRLLESVLAASRHRGATTGCPRHRAAARRNLVLSLMGREGYVSPELAVRARAEPLRLAPAEWRPVRGSESYAMDPVRAVVDSILGDAAGTAGDLVVHTTLDASAQRASSA